MGAEISWETRLTAANHYIYDGMTYEQVSNAVGVSMSQLKRWSDEHKWRLQREQYRTAQMEELQDIVLLRRDLVRNAIATKDPQDVYAAAKITTIAHDAMARRETPEIPVESIRSPRDAVKALEDRVLQQLNGMLLTSGGVTCAGINRVHDSLTLIGKMKQLFEEDKADGADKKDGADKTRETRELDPETKQKIRDLYGL